MSFVQQGTTKVPTAVTNSFTFVFDSTPAAGDLMVVVSQGTSNPDPGTTGFSSQVQVANAISIFAKLAGASESNSYLFGGTTGLTGTGPAMYGAVFRTTGGVVRSPTGLNIQTQLSTTAASGTVDPAGITDRPSVLLVSVMRASGASSGTIAWNGGGTTTPNQLTGRGGFDFIALSAIPADVKAVWSLGTATSTAVIGFAEMQGPGFM